MDWSRVSEENKGEEEREKGGEKERRREREEEGRLLAMWVKSRP